jgi:hypothetical protein
VNPLQRGGEAVGRTWHRSRRGTARTAAWVKDGITGSFDSARDRIGGLRSDGEKPTKAKAVQADSPPGLLDRARGDHRIAIAWVAGTVLLLAWIGWTIHIWSTNGSTAGLGVLITWPALFAVAAIVAAPFVGAGMLVHRHRLAGDGAPEIGDGETEDADEKEDAEVKDEDSDADEKDESG